jgi:hypothetical protein
MPAREKPAVHDLQELAEQAAQRIAAAARG